MPELPEAETIARSLRKVLPGRRIERVLFSGRQLLRKGSESPSRLEGARIVDVGRVGKNVVLKAAPQRNMVVNLGMTGRLLYGRRGGFPRHYSGRHVHLRLLLSAGTEIRLQDTRRFGFILVTKSNDIATVLGLGKDPFEITPRELAAILGGRSAPIKALLLDQKLLSGLGNIYVDETLFLARVHPLEPARKVAPRSALLLSAARKVLREAIRYRGTTISDYRTSEGSGGAFQKRLSVYGRKGQACLLCGTAVEKIRVAGRGTHLCPSCQR